MKPEELRIGNYIYNGIGEVFQANGETIAHFYTSESILGKFKPIPLTEQWLLDFGFLTEGYNCFEISIQKFVVCEDWALLSYDFDTKEMHIGSQGDMYYSIGNKLEYVHQLQNLYYCLTGKELTK